MRIGIDWGGTKIEVIALDETGATLAERFGANASLADVLQALSASCPHQHQRDLHPGPECGAYYPDLPPDLPAALQPQRLRLIVGGRSQPP